MKTFQYFFFTDIEDIENLQNQFPQYLNSQILNGLNYLHRCAKEYNKFNPLYEEIKVMLDKYTEENIACVTLLGIIH